MNDIKKNITKNIAFYRKKNKITQKELAEKLNLKNSSVSNWEQGANAPDIDVIFKICQIFNISLSDLFGCDAVSEDSILVYGSERALIEAYRTADNIDKEIVLRTLNLDNKSKNRESEYPNIESAPKHA